MDRSHRDAVVARDGFACRACGRPTRGQVHHVLDRALGGSDGGANLVTLCGRCHMLVSPIAVEVLLAYFEIDEAELLARKARVQVAICTWVLSGRPAPLPSPRPVPRPRLAKSRSPETPEWKRRRPRAGCRWSLEEDADLLTGFDAGVPVAEVAARLGRGEFAVGVRLHKLGRVGAWPGPRPP